MGSAGLRSKRFLGLQRADGAKSLVPMGCLRSTVLYPLAVLGCVVTCQVQIDQEMEVSLLLGTQKLDLDSNLRRSSPMRSMSQICLILWNAPTSHTHTSSHKLQRFQVFSGGKHIRSANDLVQAADIQEMFGPWAAPPVND